jgi:hypothetical protein
VVSGGLGREMQSGVYEVRRPCPSPLPHPPPPPLPPLSLPPLPPPPRRPAGGPYPAPASWRRSMRAMDGGR